MILRVALSAIALLLGGVADAFGQVSIAYDTGHQPVAYAVQRLAQTFARYGQTVEMWHLSQAAAGAPSIVVLTARDPIPGGLGGGVQAADLESIAPEGFELRWANGGERLLVLASDPVGAMYGLMEVRDHVASHGDFRTLRPHRVDPGFEYRIVKFNLPWSPYRPGEATELHTHVVRDLAFWERFLDMMVDARLNVLSLWNNHPFPFMIRATNFPLATPFDDAELADWQRFWRSLFAMAKQRGIQTFIVNWNIVVSPEFAEAYGASEYNDLSELVRRYTRESVTQLIDEYEDLTGIGVTLADWMGTFNESMTPEQREAWIEETFVAGMKAASRDVKFIHRSVLAGDPMAMRRLIDRAELSEPVLVEIKFNWSHGHSTPTLAITHDYHSGQLDERFWSPLPDNYRIQWMVRNEDFFILRWGQPDFVREHIATNRHEYVNGYFIGSEGYVPAVDYSHVPSPVKTWQYAFEKQWLFYWVWGRLLYDPDTPDAVFEAEMDRRYGQGVGGPLLEAYRRASNMPLRLASFFRSTWDYTLYSEGFTSAARASNTAAWDPTSPFISILEFIDHETLDPRLVSIPEYTESWLSGSAIPEGKVTPLELADASEEDSRRALELVDGLRSRVNAFSGALESELDDVAAWAHLGFYLADKLRAGVALDRFRKTGDASHRDAAVALLERCLEHWDRVVGYTRNRYVAVPHVALASAREERFRYFSWENYRSEVERDIEIARTLPPDAQVE